MTLVIAILMALTAIGATPEAEADGFAALVIMTCRPVITADFVGCEVPVVGSEDEPAYAGWSNGEAITGP